MLALKIVHVSCVTASFSLFFLRGYWLLRGSPVMRQRWVKIAPHTVDSLLLASAIALAWQLGYSPANAPWLAAKICALLLYIGLGMLAFRFGQTWRTRFVAWLCAQAVFFYIVAVAITHNPLLST
jgi:uncharacterized membrane protein SirB2